MKTLIACIERFVPLHSHADEVWKFLLPARKGRAWIQLHVQKVYGRYHLTDDAGATVVYPPESRDRDDEGAERSNRDVPALARLWIPMLKGWIDQVAENPIAAQSRLAKRLPTRLRTGVILRRNAARALPQLDLASHFTKRDLHDLIELFLSRPTERSQTMKAEIYFDYCKVAYEANPKSFSRLGFKKQSSGRAYYERFADGRDGGLLDVDPTSTKAFEAWHGSTQRQGCHPWEIYRGGNSTHIDLRVERADSGWAIALNAYSSTRMVEACRIALALHRANMPCIVHDAASYLLRLRGEDWVGIVPEGESIAYAWQRFPREYSVADVVHFSWLIESVPSNERRAYAAITNWHIDACSAWLR
jgi:hypothetical protein